MEDNLYENESRRDNTKTILIVIIVVLLGVIGYLLYLNSQKTEHITIVEQKYQKQEVDLSSKVKELEELQVAYQRIKLDREALGLTNDSLNKEIERLNEYVIQVKQNKIKIKQLDATIARIKADLDARDAEITTLRAQNDTLRTNVESLTKEKSSFADSISQLNTKRTELEEKVAIASVLRAENLQVSVINRKDKELHKDEYKAKNIDKLKVTFNVGENRVARKEKKNIYFRLVQPDGSVLFDLATGGGFFTLDGKEVPYTAKQDIEFDNTKQNVTFIYVKGSAYVPGRHIVELYHDSSKIGETQIIVK